MAEKNCTCGHSKRKHNDEGCKARKKGIKECKCKKFNMENLTNGG